ncbi:MAG: DUF4153 domain-containing protein [Candidatus Gracilibacteria bacterium]
MHIFSWSFENIFQAVRTSINRFPLSILLAALITVFGISFTHNQDSDIVRRFLLIFVTLFPASVALSFFLEKKQLPFLGKIGSYLGFVALIAAYYFILPFPLSAAPAIYIIYSLIIFVLGLVLMTLVPLSNIKEYYWEHVVSLLFNAIVTIFCAVCIFIAITVAFGSISLLFSVDISSTTYTDFWIIVTALFSPVFFLSRIPVASSKVQPHSQVAFPLQWFALYIAFPATVIYFAILYTYSAKILFTGMWPNGQVALLVLGFSIIGLLTFVILHSRLSEHKNARIWKPLFFLILLPQVVMLFLATWLRIDSVGITESRYALLAGGVWLSITSLYFIISRQKRLEVLSLSLLVIILIGSIGPWSIGEVSKNSQMHELSELLEKNGAFKDNKVVAIPSPIGGSDADRISNIVSYLDNTHSIQVLAPWFDKDISALSRGEIISLLNLDPATSFLGWNRGTVTCYIRTENTESSIDVSGYDLYLSNISENIYSPNTQPQNMSISGKNYTLTTDHDTFTVRIKEAGAEIAAINMRDYLNEVAKQNCSEALKGNSTSAEKMSYLFENEKLRVKFQMNSIEAEKVESSQDAPKIISFYGQALVDIK